MSRPAAALAHRVAPTAVTRASPWRRSRRTPGRPSRCDAIPPNKEWPPADVWQDFREAVGGEWVGHAMTLGPTGTVVPLPDKYVPDSFKEYGVGVNQWSTRATTDYAGDGGIDEVDSFTTTTKYLWPEAGCEFGKEDVALTRGDTDALMGGGQMGKMCVVDGDYAHGPLKLPPCEPGAEVKFQFGFSRRTPDPADDQGPAGPIKLNPNPKPTTRQLPKRRIRVEVTVEARPGEKRDWRLASVEVISESRKDSEIDPGSPEIASKLGEDDISTGEWRAIQGVTFLTCESLLDDEAFDASFDDAPPSMTLAPSDSEKTDEQLDEEKMRTRVGQGKGRTGRGRVKKNGVKGTTDTLTDVVVPTVVKSEAELAAEKEAERVAWNLRRRNRPPPTGLVVVPSWAVEAKGPFSSAYEYLVGGNSPLVLLPMRGWCLVESVNDELLVEVGVYAGAGGLDEVGFDSAAKEGGGSEPRRVAARRYERGGRFASAFFVEESRMTREELEQEKGEGEGGNPLYF